MKERLNSAEIKHHNKQFIYRTLLALGSSTKAEIAARTRLSIPTATQAIEELTAAGLIEETGYQASSGGRRAVSFRALRNARLSVGVDVSRNHLNLALVNLAGEVVASRRIRTAITPGPSFYEDIRGPLLDFLSEESVRLSSLAGLGVSLPGIISRDQTKLLYSHVLGLDRPLGLKPILPEAGIPVRFFNDATSACMAELYTGTAPSDFCFVFLGNSVGGAFVNDKKILPGYHERSGEIGHILIVPGGRKCYCGKCGHYDPYGSALLLSEPAGGQLSVFFRGLEEGNAEYAAIFDEYLQHLALLIYDLGVMTDTPVILGGYVAGYLTPYLDRLSGLVRDLNIFEGSDNMILLSHYQFEASAVGSARYFIEDFISSL